jgi:hypothetical protein
MDWTKSQQEEYCNKNKRRVEAPSLKEEDRVYLRRRNLGQRNIFNINVNETGPLTNRAVYDQEKAKFRHELVLPPRVKIYPVFSEFPYSLSKTRKQTKTSKPMRHLHSLLTGNNS